MLNIQHLEQNIIDNFSRIGYKKLTEIQRKAIPVIVRQKNALIISATGTGKTEAAIIPIINLVARTDQPKKGINIIYVTPLKALNRDIFRRIQEYAEDNGLTAKIRHGDTTRTERTKMVENPPNILITTPETPPSLTNIFEPPPIILSEIFFVFLSTATKSSTSFGMQNIVALPPD